MLSTNPFNSRLMMAACELATTSLDDSALATSTSATSVWAVSALAAIPSVARVLTSSHQLQVHQRPERQLPVCWPSALATSGVDIEACKPKRHLKRCYHSQCLSIAKGNGVCVKHGYINKAKMCSHPQCLSIAKENDICIKHGYIERRGAWCMDA